MDSGLLEAMTSGVYLDFRDSQGHTVGQAVYLDWRGRPLPSVGDAVSCTLDTDRNGSRKLVGLVRTRHFDVQKQDDGEPAVWVSLVVDTDVSKRAATATRATKGRSAALRFSAN